MREHAFVKQEAHALLGRYITEFSNTCCSLAVAEFGSLEWQELRKKQLELKAVLEQNGLLGRLDGWLRQVARSIETHIPIRDDDRKIRLYPLPEI
jgi:hypothetical protein